jgi:hypothetical protein
MRRTPSSRNRSRSRTVGRRSDYHRYERSERDHGRCWSECTSLSGRSRYAYRSYPRRRHLTHPVGNPARDRGVLGCPCDSRANPPGAGSRARTPAAGVGSELSQHAHRAPKTRSRYCLIRTFTTRESLEAQSGNCFASNRNSVSGADQIKIDASHNYNRLGHKDAQLQFFPGTVTSEILEPPRPRPAR